MNDLKYVDDTFYSNLKLTLGALGTPSPSLSFNMAFDNDFAFVVCTAVIVALGAQFYPVPFPESRPFLWACVVVYVSATEGWGSPMSDLAL